MRIKNNRICKNARNSFVPTEVKGVRAEKEFWEKCDKVAKVENTSRNELIVRVADKYCNRKLEKIAKKALDNK